MQLESLSSNKTLKYLAIALTIAALFILAKELFLKQKPLPVVETAPVQIMPVQIDLGFLESAQIKGLLPFQEISLPKKIGRQNPFEAYKPGEIEEEVATTTAGATTTTEATTTEETD